MQELQTIVALETTAPGRSRVFFKTGEVREVEWAQFADDGPIFQPFKDPDFATSCEIVEDGDGLEWPNGADWSADAVYLYGTPVTTTLKKEKLQSDPAARRRSA